ncbi:MAG: heme-binding protein [Pseudomonadota bacterium]
MRWLTMLALATSLLGAPAMAIEEPEFEVLASTDDYDIRRYSPYIVAEVDVPGDQRTAGGRAFRVLAGYIFGDNVPEQKMAMTAPVESAPRGVKMNMTAPVEAVATDDAGYTYAFVMERKYSMDSLPKPNNPSIRLVQRPARTMAVRRFSGRANAVSFEQRRKELMAALERDAIMTLGPAALAQYNAPYTPGILRRNEVLVEVAWPEQAAASTD